MSLIPFGAPTDLGRAGRWTDLPGGWQLTASERTPFARILPTQAAADNHLERLITIPGLRNDSVRRLIRWAFDRVHPYYLNCLVTLRRKVPKGC
jgi:hypothetical protein